MCLRGLVLPVLVALRDIAPGEQLLRDYGAAWWREVAGVWEVAENQGMGGEALLHSSGGKLDTDGSRSTVVASGTCLVAQLQPPWYTGSSSGLHSIRSRRRRRLRHCRHSQSSSSWGSIASGNRSAGSSCRRRGCAGAKD